MRNNRMPALLRADTDPLELAIQICRKRETEVFWTLRMNDIHDYTNPLLRAKWKTERPELVMGTPEEAARHHVRDPRSIWTLADYGREEVRDLMARGVAEVLENYDVDGIELDFLRHICYFRETRLYQPVTALHRRQMSDLVHRIRRLVLEASERKRKPILLSARVLQTLELNERFGLEVEQWVKKGDMDFLTISAGFVPFTCPTELIRQCQAWGLPAYGCVTREAMSQKLWSGPEIPHSELRHDRPESWLGAAANNWARGVDGIMAFNLFPEYSGIDFTRQLLKDMSEPGNLVGLDKLFCIEHLHNDDYCWMIKSVPREERLPVVITKGTWVHRVLPVGDDIAGLSQRVRGLRLRLYLDHLREPDKVTVQLNGTALDCRPEQAQWLAVDLPPALVRKGPNDLMVKFEAGNSASWDLTLRSVELSVKYDQA